MALFVKRFYSSTSGISMNRLIGKTAVLTASTDGIALAVARRLGQEGANIVVSSRKEENVQKAVNQLKSEGLTVEGVKCHVSNAEDRKRLYNKAVQSFGGIDILVSNAAVNPSRERLLECSEEVWDKIMDVNVKSSFLLAKEVVPFMRKRGGGSIVFMASIAAFSPDSKIGAYSVSKTALVGLTRAAALDLAAEGIRVNCYAPGPTNTTFGSYMFSNEDMKKTVMNQIPIKRIGEPHEMGGVVAFLVSDDASYIVGETIIVSGGFASRL